MLDGAQALSTVGQRLEERGMMALVQPGLTRAALHDDRLGHRRDALLAANLNKVCSTRALQALAVDALPTPWLPQDPTAMALYGVDADEPQSARAPRPADGPSQDGRDDRQQGRLSLGGSGAGGRPRRGGVRAGHGHARVATPRALEAGLA